MMNADELPLLTPDELCEILRVKKSCLYDQVEADTIPYLRLGNQLRFERSAIAGYLRRQGRGSTDETGAPQPLRDDG